LVEEAAEIYPWIEGVVVVTDDTFDPESQIQGGVLPEVAMPQEPRCY